MAKKPYRLKSLWWAYIVKFCSVQEVIFEDIIEIDITDEW